MPTLRYHKIQLNIKGMRFSRSFCLNRLKNSADDFCNYIFAEGSSAFCIFKECLL